MIFILIMFKMVLCDIYIICKTCTFFLLCYYCLYCLQKEPISQVRQRIQAKLDVPDKEFEKVFACQILLYSVHLLR